MKGLPHTPDVLRAIREGLVAGLTYSEIGDPLGLSRSAVAGIAHRHARGVGRSSNFRNADPKTPRWNRKRDRPDVLQAVFSAVEAGMTDDGLARVSGICVTTLGVLRQSLAEQGIVLPRNAPKSAKAGRKGVIGCTTRPKAAAPAPKPSASIPPKPSALLYRGLTLVSSTSRPVQLASSSWT